MVANLIEIDYEFIEVLNAFPILKKVLNDMDFNVSDVRDGESVSDYLGKKCKSQEEVNFLVRKMNQVVNNFFKSNNDLIKEDFSSNDLLEMVEPELSTGNPDDELAEEEE